ncbi:hypothetical protein WA026_002208 [Henosepilachna vigintioctopunctata]|uniref:Gag-like protein n=1 Tax=Henosepilachna vigintioctopunctata TaxID=420089 RepID=A0AAW1TQP9_9CUCU
MNSSAEPPDKGGGITSKVIREAFNTLLETDFDNMDTSNFPLDASSVNSQSTPSVSSLHARDNRRTSVSKSNSTNSSVPKENSISNNIFQLPSSNSLRERISARYDLTDVGPFIVYVESKNRNIGNLHAMSIGKMIHRSDNSIANSILSLEKNGKNRIKISFRSYLGANKFLMSKFLIDNNLEAYIPSFLIRRQGVIRSIDLDITDEELKTHIEPLTGSVFKILEVRRLTKKIVKDDGSLDFVPTTSILITFKGQSLPDRIVIFSCVREVFPYVQRVVQCKKCLRFGHVDNLCRSNPRCVKCGGPHVLDKCESDTPVCVNCKGNHLSNDSKSCPSFETQRKIKQKMAVNNMAYREAVESIKNSFSITTASTVGPVITNTSPPKNDKHFPPLKIQKRRQPVDLSSSELKRKHLEIIKPFPFTGENGGCLKKKSIGFSYCPQTEGTDVSSLINIIFHVVKNILKDFSGSDLTNFENGSNVDFIENKIRELLNGS